MGGFLGSAQRRVFPVVQFPKHIGLSRGQPYFTHNHVGDFERILSAHRHFERAGLRTLEIEQNLPFSIGRRRGFDRLAVHAHRHFLPGTGIAPERHVVARLQNHVVGKDRRKCDIGHQGARGK